MVYSMETTIKQVAARFLVFTQPIFYVGKNGLHQCVSEKIAVKKDMQLLWKTQKIMVKITLYFCRVYEFATVSVGSWCCGTDVGATRCIKKLLATVLLYSVSETLPPFGISKTIRWLSRTFSLVITKGGSWEPSSGSLPNEKNGDHAPRIKILKTSLISAKRQKNCGCRGAEPPE